LKGLTPLLASEEVTHSSLKTKPRRGGVTQKKMLTKGQEKRRNKIVRAGGTIWDLLCEIPWGTKRRDKKYLRKVGESGRMNTRARGSCRDTKMGTVWQNASPAMVENSSWAEKKKGKRRGVDRKKEG